jgi:hypothetical protein
MTRSTAQIANDAQHYIKMTRSVTQSATARYDVSDSAIETQSCCKSLYTAESEREVCREQLDERSVTALISFFEVLCRWDREVRHNAETM